MKYTTVRENSAAREVEPVDAAVVRVESGVVVDVDAGEHPPFAHGLNHGSCHNGFFAGALIGTRPDAVEIRLPVQPTQPRMRGRHIADKNGQGARQLLGTVLFQYRLYGLESDIFVAV